MVDNINFGSCNPDKYNDISLFSSSASGRLSPDDLHLYSSLMRDQHHDGLLPIANVGRIMKQILPPNAKISKEGKETMQECVSEFISFVTGEASDRCHKEKRKTVNGDDICWALNCLGFDNYADPLRGYLNRYRDIEGERAAHSGSSIANKASSSSYVPNNSSSYGVGGEGGETDHQSPSPTLLNFNVGNQIRRQSH